jgi:hypothetical protein
MGLSGSFNISVYPGLYNETQDSIDGPGQVKPYALGLQ